MCLVPDMGTRLDPLGVAAHACLAEMEQAAADAEALRSSDLVQAWTRDGRSTAPSARADPTAARRAAAQLEEAADVAASYLKSRIRPLWAACAVPDGLEAMLSRAAEAAKELANAEILMARAAGSEMSGVGGGGVILQGAKVIGGECAQLASLLAALRRHAHRLRSAHAAVAQREQLVAHLRSACSRLAPMHAANATRHKLERPGAPKLDEMIASVEAEIVSTVVLLRQATVRVVEAILAWRGGLTAPAPFPARLASTARLGHTASGHEMAESWFASSAGAPLSAGALRSRATAAAAAQPPQSVAGGDGIAAHPGGQCTAAAAAATVPCCRAQPTTPNYLRHMATDLDGLAEISSRMPSVYTSPPHASTDEPGRRRAVDLEPITELRARQQHTPSDAAAEFEEAVPSEGSTAPTPTAPLSSLRWRPLQPSDLSKVVSVEKGAAAGGETQGSGLSPAAAAQLPCLLDVAAPKSSDEELLRDLGELAVAPLKR